MFILCVQKQVTYDDKLTNNAKLKIFCQINIKTKMQGEQEIYNEVIPGGQQAGFSRIYRQKGRQKLISTPFEHVRTVRDIAYQCKDKFGSRPGIGKVILTSQNSTESRIVETKTYSQIFNQAEYLGKSILSQKLYFSEPQRGMNLIGIYSNNRPEWFVTDWACAIFGLTIVPLYDTLGAQSLAYCIQTTGIATLFVSSKTAKELSGFDNKGSLKNIVLYDTLDEELTQKLNNKGYGLLYYTELLEQGKQSDVSHKDIEVKPESIYSFCYTSGTTGPPKGALISHQNILAAVSSFILHKDLAFCSEDVYLSYLPLPHLMQRTIANCMFISGAFLVVSCGNPAKIKEDSAAIKSTVFISVPRVFNRIVEAVNKSIIEAVKQGVNKEQYEEKLYQEIRNSYGGKIRIMAGGSAPITAQVQQTMQKIMNCPLIEGYGQTQATCAIVFSRKTNSDFAKMHELSPAVQMKLCDIPQMKYTCQDIDQQGRLTPRGQIWTRGPQIFQGYYKRDQANRQTIEPNGWIKSGDVGEITPNLALRIIDRKKNIFKLQQGQYVAPDKVERIYLKSGFLQEVFLHGTSINSFAVAIAVPNKEIMSKMAIKFGIEGPFEVLCQYTDIRKTLLQEMNLVSRSQGLHGFQLAKNIHFVSEGFAGKGILTNTMKIIRYQARNFFKKEIVVMYKQGELK